MKIQDLQNGQIVRYRMGRYQDDLPAPDWGAWRNGPLYVQRFKGVAVTLTPRNDNWADYDPRRDKPSYGGTLECEGYYLQIEGLEDES
jgi:hypothetical protein